MDHLKTLIREVPDFPKAGILFYDITTLLKEPHGLKGVIDGFKDHYKNAGVDLAIGMKGPTPEGRRRAGHGDRSPRIYLRVGAGLRLGRGFGPCAQAEEAARRKG